ncbi:hypothetical protein [Paenibacillus cucumis (ex Kampfer et al. 2016)]|uniref:DUF2188 domain-containing protein n=1 Tax=Paenibacillus cucumis (ex Kampfer et al. 2016) TaxID=1776858 RepID=A0ABS7KMC5_9BACL|nr:hypothetical protein [Paenibacillus cucumis (ex Kampfer et al. 2016)]MBY0205280.1 hypothetical protein [Paenibacillus cucumis (ex Kampfer et al. 2016)]
MSKRVTHYFYVGEQRVWFSEWYEPLSKEDLQKRALIAAERGYGTPDTVIDSTGRMVKLGGEGADTE